MATTAQTETSNVITTTITVAPTKTALKVVYGAMALGKKEGTYRIFPSMP